jgi:hypothetical protein
MRAAIRQLLFAESPFRPSQLFASGEQGAWYDPSDLSNMFQDASGTTPAALEQPVGLLRDKSGRGNHASQTTLAARPVLSARYNLLTYSEQFNNAYWGKATGATISANTTDTTDPLGGNTADKLIETTANTTHRCQANGTSASVTGGATNTYTVSCAMKAGTRTWGWISIANSSGTSQVIAYFDLANGVVGSVVLTGTASSTSSITSLGNGWYRCTVTGRATTTAGDFFGPYFGATQADGVIIYPGATDKHIYIWGADLRVSNDDVGIPSYQRVAAATDYDTAGFPQRVNYDRVDDAHIAASGGGSTTAFFFCASIRINAIGQTQTIYSDTGTNTGYRIRINSSNQLEMAVGNGSAYTTVNTTDTFAIGERAVITCWHDGVNIYAQKNKGTVASTAFATATAGTAGFTLGKDNDAASNFFGGGLYQYVHTQNAYKGDSARAKAQDFCASKALVTL